MFRTLIKQHMKTLMGVIKKQHTEMLMNSTKYTF